MRLSSLVLLLVLWSGPVRAEGIASFQAATWDKEIILPPYAYRATRPIELDGNFAVRTQPNTLVDGVNFRGLKGAQDWEIRGTLMRRVRIGGQLGVSAHGVDSVFEDCEFNKDSGWFVSWWGTHWRFENCIFTKRFIRADLSPTDYSVRASLCTFYSVKLPTVGLKENAAGYLQKENMSFEKCRFVDCDVPETFLAATVDCVFEHCQFAPKAKLKWPPETGPVTVTAYFAGLDEGPAPFLNGPLSVQFPPAPKDLASGSTLVHTQSGGRVTLASLHLDGESVALGTEQKKASEIVDGQAPTPAPRAVAPASNPTPSTVAATALRGLEETLQTMPPNIDLLTGGQPNVPGVIAANAWLAKNCVGRTVAMRMTLEGTQAATAKEYAYQANGRAQGVLYHGDTIASRAFALFRLPAAAALGAVQRDADFNVRGVVRGAQLTGRGNALVYTLTIGDAQVGDFAAPPPITSPAVR